MQLTTFNGRGEKLSERLALGGGSSLGLGFSLKSQRQSEHFFGYIKTFFHQRVIEKSELKKPGEIQDRMVGYMDDSSPLMKKRINAHYKKCIPCFTFKVESCFYTPLRGFFKTVDP